MLFSFSSSLWFNCCVIYLCCSLDHYGYGFSKYMSGLNLKELQNICISDVGNLSFSFYIHWNACLCIKICKYIFVTLNQRCVEWFQILAFMGGIFTSKVDKNFVFRSGGTVHLYVLCVATDLMHFEGSMNILLLFNFARMYRSTLLSVYRVSTLYNMILLAGYLRPWLRTSSP